MNNPEGGPGPEEIEGLNHPPHIEPQEAVDRPRIPARIANWFRNLRRPRPVEDPAIDQEIHDIDVERQQEAHDRYENQRLERARDIDQIELPRDPNDLVELLGNVTVAQWRERKLSERYGQGPIGRFKAFMAGEYDFTFGESGQVEGRNAGLAFTRRVLRTLGNKQVLIGAAAAIGIGALTGGAAIPAIAAIGGTIVGRGAGEAAQAIWGKESRLNEEVARAEYREFRRLQEMALSSQEEGISITERNHRLENLVSASTAANEEIIARQRELIADDAKWNNVKKWCGVAGGAAGFAMSASGLMNMDIDGNGIFHNVSLHDGQWVFSYNNAAERAADVAFAQTHNYGLTVLGDVGQFGGHALNESTATVIGNILQHAAPAAGAVIGGAMGTHYWEKGEEARRQNALNADLADRDRVNREERDFHLEQVPHDEEQPPEPGSHRWCVERFGEDNLPEPGKIWILQMGPERQIIRIRDINFASNEIQFEELDVNRQAIPGENGQDPVVTTMPIDRWAEFAFMSADNLTEDWLRLFAPNDRMVVNQDLQVENRQIPAGEYTITRVEGNPNQVVLHREGQPDIPVPAFALAFYDIRRVQPERRREEARVEDRLPHENEIFRLGQAERAGLPAACQNLPADFVIQSIEARDRLIIVNGLTPQNQPDRAARSEISYDDWLQVVAVYQRRGRVQPPQNQGGGGGGRRNNPGGGGGGGQRGGGGDDRGGGENPDEGDREG